MNPLLPYLEPLPLIAVLRGIAPEEIPAIADALVAEGFRVLEVPLNSPRPFDSIRLLAQACGDRCLVGAGTVLDVADVARVRAAGGNVVVMPHADTAVIRAAKVQGMVCVPGVATNTEAIQSAIIGTYPNITCFIFINGNNIITLYAGIILCFGNPCKFFSFWVK